MAVATLIVVAIGEITQQPRYYEYISRLAPQDSKEPTWALPSCLLGSARLWRVVWRALDSPLWRSDASAGTHLVAVTGVGVATAGCSGFMTAWFGRTEWKRSRLLPG